MATYYFDTNGATAGFGTLTGNWNPSTALWSTSTAGTAATAAVTFTNADVAQFGFAGTAGTAGTATITAAVTNTVNQVVTANLAGMQTIAGPGTLELAGTTPTITVGSAGGLTISAPITGTAGFNLTAGVLYIGGTTKALNTSSPGSSVTISGTLFINAASPTGSVDQLANVSRFIVNGTVVYSGNTAYTEDAAIEGSGGIQANLNGTAMTYSGNLSAFSGLLSCYEDTNGLTNPIVFSTASSFPAAASTYTDIGGNGFTNTFTLTYTGADPVTQTGSNYSYFRSANGTSTMTTEYANSSSSNATVTYAGTFGPYPGGFSGGTHNVRFNTASGDIVASGNIVSGGVTTRAVAKTGTYKATLSGNNTYTGTTSISAGTLSAQSAAAFGAAASAVTQTGGTIDVSGNTALNKAGGALTLISAAGATALSTTTGTNTLACAGITLSSTIIVAAAAGASLTVNNTAAMSGAFGITKNDSGEIGLGTFANTYTGAVTINAGTLTVGNLQNTSTASSLGTGALSSAIALTGTLKYNGTGHSTNRSITFTGAAPTLDASGTGAVTYSACTQAAGARTITLTGTSLAAVNNTFSATLADGTGAVGVAKTGSNKWILSGALNHTGTTSCAEGTLNLGSTNRTISSPISVSGGVLENSTNTVATSGGVTMTGGTVTAEITSTTTVTVNSGTTARLEPTNSANTYTGATAINASGKLEVVTNVDPEAAGAGKVLGNSAVTVGNGGEIITSANANQRGQMRYGGNLTFNSGAILRIGFAA